MIVRVSFLKKRLVVVLDPSTTRPTKNLLTVWELLATRFFNMKLEGGQKQQACRAPSRETEIFRAGLSPKEK